jgi:predicted RNA binding protein YcfA (HicA-like mRNA interferase family)
MVKGYYEDVTRLLAAAGWRFSSSAKGSHEKWAKASEFEKLIVPKNLMSRHTANGILKSAKIEKKL